MSTRPSSPEPIAVSLPSTQEIDNVKDTVYKPCESFCSPGKPSSSLLGRSPNSLNRLMAGRSSLKSVRSAFVLDLENRQQKKDVSFDAYGYGYGYGADEEEKTLQATQQGDELPAQKRRRFQRRNSKTPAMLMAMNSPLLLHLDFLEEKKESEKASAGSTATTTKSQSWKPDSWDGGLEIAEELVKHLQKHRKSNANA